MSNHDHTHWFEYKLSRLREARLDKNAKDYARRKAEFVEQLAIFEHSDPVLFAKYNAALEELENPKDAESSAFLVALKSIPMDAYGNLTVTQNTVPRFVLALLSGGETSIYDNELDDYLPGDIRVRGDYKVEALQKLCDFLNRMNAQLKAYEDLTNSIPHGALSVEQHDRLSEIWAMEGSDHD